MQRVVRKQREVVMIHIWVFLLLPLIVARSIMAGSVVSRQVGWYLSCLAQWFQIAEIRQKYVYLLWFHAFFQASSLYFSFR